MRQFFLSLFALIFPVAAATGAPAQTLSDMAGQMVMVGFQGTSTEDAGFRAVRAQLAARQIGGVMYLRTNVESLADVRAMNQALAAASPWLTPLIALDQEGGQIRRLTRAVGFTQIPSAAALGQGSVAQAQAVYTDLAERLAELGFSVNFGPVVDLNLNPANPIIARYERAFGADPFEVARFGAAFVEGHRAAGLATALKHFPGHGSSTGDTHEGFVDVTADWREIELEPFARLIDDDLADMVMVAHLFNANYARDPGEQLPASLSPAWIDGVLRGDLGFDGVVISDDLQMGAITARFDLRETVVRAVMAGNDILLFSNTADYTPDLGAQIHAIIVNEARENAEFAGRVAESYRRIVALRQGLGAGR
ncbi:glycoside hydrolase family 3 protein [Pelagibacterium xiamenense]|uniref:glycoside hydrolase family 3 protein n=1 Tax=Pelagibacterium xiamenense TaxID=2901140 RepID=UPI001E510BA2|nr:glycoside hydrolase family 3 N-terminal domain-containing protein [Pelagibacterium xiamenense]MCD7060058.1 glycoside hydrolase family 3 protein [Pelagibacterium xiamenense]